MRPPAPAGALSVPPRGAKNGPFLTDPWHTSEKQPKAPSVRQNWFPKRMPVKTTREGCGEDVVRGPVGDAVVGPAGTVGGTIDTHRTIPAAITTHDEADAQHYHGKEFTAPEACLAFGPADNTPSACNRTRAAKDVTVQRRMVGGPGRSLLRLSMPAQDTFTGIQ